MKKIIAIVLASVLTTSFIAYRLHAWDVDRIEARAQIALNAAVKAENKKLTDEFSNVKKDFEVTNNAYQNKIDDLYRKLDANGLLPSVCVAVFDPATGSSLGDGAGWAGSVRTGGITSTALRRQFGQGRAYQIKFEACQETLKGIRRRNGG